MAAKDIKRLGFPRAPRIAFDEAVDRIIHSHDERDSRTGAQKLVDNETLGMAAFMVRWMLEENTGSAPKLYDRAKKDYEAWRTQEYGPR